MLIYVDGSSSSMGNQIAVADSDENLLINKKFKKKLTNNELEYEAILAGLNIATEKDTICSDSKLCVEQINGNFKIKQEHLKPYAEKSKELLKEKKCLIIWVPRDKNPAGRILEREVKQGVKRAKKNKLREAQ